MNCAKWTFWNEIKFGLHSSFLNVINAEESKKKLDLWISPYSLTSNISLVLLRISKIFKYSTSTIGKEGDFQPWFLRVWKVAAIGGEESGWFGVAFIIDRVFLSFLSSYQSLSFVGHLCLFNGVFFLWFSLFLTSKRTTLFTSESLKYFFGKEPFSILITVRTEQTLFSV